MTSKNVIVKNNEGMDSKFIAALIVKASSYSSNISIEKGERKANAKSLLGLLSLGISKGTSIVVAADGTDEEAATVEISKFIELYS